MKAYHDIATDGGSDVLGQVGIQQDRLKRRLAQIGSVLAVMSGKGGVGKSTTAVCLADALARSGRSVGLADGDVNGASLGRMTGVRGTPLRRQGSAVAPATTATGVRVMSMDLFLEDETAPVVWDAPTQTGGAAWRGLREAGAVRELIADTEWGALDVLLIDLPPGSHRLPELAGVLPRIDGAVVVTIPSAISVGVVGRSVRMAKEHLDVDTLGVVENMASHVCPHCGMEDALFPPAAVGSLQLEVLGRIPFDPVLGIAADAGRSFVTEYPERPAARAFIALARTLESRLD